MTEDPTKSSESLPVVGYFNSFGNALCKGVPRFSTDIALTPHAPAQAQIDALRVENERLRRELDAFRNQPVPGDPYGY